MQVYDYTNKWGKLLTPEVVRKLTQIYEYKGEHQFFIKNNQEELKELVEIASLENIEAFVKMLKLDVECGRLKKLAQSKTLPSSKNEFDIACYRDVLNFIQINYNFIPIHTNHIVQLQRDLFKHHKSKEHSAFSRAIGNLCRAFSVAQKNVDPLILSIMFVFDFLHALPFNNGNKRLSRIITQLLLYKNNFFVGKYISLENLIEKTKEDYYKAIHTNEYYPFVNYMLDVILKAYKEFDSKAKLLTDSNLSKTGRIREIIKKSKNEITKSELLEMNPGISDTTVQRTLATLLKNKKIKKIGGGRYTKYTWNMEA